MLFTPWIADSEQATQIIRDPYRSEAFIHITSVADPHHFGADPDLACHIIDADLDPDPACHFDADPDPHQSDKQKPDPSFQNKASKP